MAEYYKIRFVDRTNTRRVWLGRTRINYNPVFVECLENTFAIAIEKELLKSDVLNEYLKDREYELIQVEPENFSARRIYSCEDDWCR